MFRAEWRLGSGKFALVPRLSDLAIKLTVNTRFHLGSSFSWEEKLARARSRKCPMSVFIAKADVAEQECGSPMSANYPKQTFGGLKGSIFLLLLRLEAG